MPNVELIIERHGYEYWEDYDEVRERKVPRSTCWGREPVFTAVGSHVRIDSPKESLGVMSSHFRLYPVEDERDFEGDSCALVICDIRLPHTETMWYPRLEIVGFVDELLAATEVGEGEYPGSKAYAPKLLPGFTPGLYRFKLNPVDPTEGEES